MFETTFRTYWADTDAAGIVYFSHFFRFVEQAEEELFRASGKARQDVLDENNIWMPRVEAFSKYVSPIWNGNSIRVRLTPDFQGQKVIRLNFEIVDDGSGRLLASGYVTIVVIDRTRFKSIPLPPAVHAALNPFRAGVSQNEN